MQSKPRSAIIARTSSGEPSKATRSFSKIPTPWKPALAITDSFVSSVLPIDTVAMEVIISRQGVHLGPGGLSMMAGRAGIWVCNFAPELFIGQSVR